MSSNVTEKDEAGGQYAEGLAGMGAACWLMGSALMTVALLVAWIVQQFAR